MNLQEFSDTGYIHEINRLFLHPLGLALAFVPKYNQLEVLDFREDKEGIVFETTNPHKTRRIYQQMINRAPDRVAALGFWHQPSLEAAESIALQKQLLSAIGLTDEKENQTKKYGEPGTDSA